MLPPSPTFMMVNPSLSPPGLPHSAMIELNHWTDGSFYQVISRRTHKSLLPGFPQTPTNRPSYGTMLYFNQNVSIGFMFSTVLTVGDVILLHENAIITEPQAYCPPTIVLFHLWENGTLERDLHVVL